MHYSPKPMHIPDGFLSVPVSLVCWAIALVAIAYALRRANRDLGEKQVPLMGVSGGVYFRGPDAQLRGRRRHIGSPDGRGAGDDFAGAMGGAAGDDGGGQRAGVDLSGRRLARAGREHPQYGRDWRRRFLFRVSRGDVAAGAQAHRHPGRGFRRRVAVYRDCLACRGPAACTSPAPLRRISPCPRWA